MILEAKSLRRSIIRRIASIHLDLLVNLIPKLQILILLFSVKRV
mgnify:CR=1 FL=1